MAVEDIIILRRITMVIMAVTVIIIMLIRLNMRGTNSNSVSSKSNMRLNSEGTPSSN